MSTPSALRLAAAIVCSSAVVLALPSSAEAADKAGPVMGNFKIGPAINIADFGCTQFAMELEIAIALDKGENAYLGFNPQFQFGNRCIFISPTATFQYDIELPVDGLYVYPKINLGAMIFTNGEEAFFTLQPEFGIKYQIIPNFHVGGELLSFPIYIQEIVSAQYRMFFYAGFDV